MAEKKVSVRLAAVGGRQLRAELQGIGEAGEDGFRRITRQVDATSAVLRRLGGVLAGAFSLRQVVAYADAWSDLRSRVELATGSHERGAAVMARLADMARRTYSGLNETAQSWLATSRSLRDLGMSTRQTLDFTEALNNAMVVSGAKGERAAAVQQALARAMALGRLSGVQLNTVIGQGGRVAELLADHLGTTVAGLRQLGAQGAITGAVIREVLLGNLERLRAEADAMPATIGDAFTLIGNAAMALVGTWDSLSGASSAAAQALIAVADNMERLASYAAALAGFMAARWVAGFAAARLATISLATALASLRAAMIRTGLMALVVAAGELVYQFTRLVKGAGGLGEAFGLLGDVASSVWSGIVTTVGSLTGEFRAIKADISGIWAALMAYLAQKWSDFIATIAPTYNAVAEQLGVGLIDVWGPASHASMLAHAASSQGAMAGRLRESAAAQRAGAFAGVGDALGAVRDAMARADDGDAGVSLEDLTDQVDTLTDALDAAGRAGRMAGQANREGAEEARTGWAAVSEQLTNYAKTAADIGKDVGSALVNAFRAAEDAVAEFVKTGKFDFASLVTSMIADLARLAARKFLLGPLAGMLSGFVGGLGGAGGILAGILHDGGVAGATGTPSRMVPALAFAGAPRLHGGGWAGLRPDEVPAILQKGERVLSRREVAGGAGGGNVTVNIQTRDAESFRQSRTQVAADIARAVAFGRRGM